MIIKSIVNILKNRDLFNILFTKTFTMSIIYTRGDIMSVENKIKMIMAATNISGRQLGPALGLNPQAATTKISRGITSIKDLIKICDYCGADLTITTKDGTVIRLTIDDIDTDKK